MPCDDVDIYLEKIFLEGRTYVKLEEKNVTVEDFPFKYVKLRLNDKEVVYYISCNTGEIYTPKVGMEYKIYFNLTTEGENKTEVPTQQTIQPTQLITKLPVGTPAYDRQKYMDYLVSFILLVFLGIGFLILKKRR